MRVLVEVGVNAELFQLTRFPLDLEARGLNEKWRKTRREEVSRVRQEENK